MTPVRERQPLTELLRRFVWRLTVKRHEGRRHSGDPSDLGTPAIADERHFDLISASANGLFEAMNHVGCVRLEVPSRVRSYAAVTRDQAKGCAKPPSTTALARELERSTGNIFSRAQLLNRICTSYPHFFHSRDPQPAISAVRKGNPGTGGTRDPGWRNAGVQFMVSQP